MQLTLHVTNRCNLECDYCFVARGPENMPRETAFAAVELGMKGGGASGLLFYGGEPLLERQLIYDVVDYARSVSKKTGHNFYYKMTTNGILLDEEFLRFSKEVNLTIGFSHDGPSQDDNRRFPDGSGTAGILEEKIPLLLKYQPYAVGMSVMNPRSISNAAATVNFLFEQGFRYITCNLNYDKKAPWTAETLDLLEAEYKKMAELYVKWTRAEEKFYLSPIDMKIISHVKGAKYQADRRRMAMNQPSVMPDGKVYYGSKTVGNPLFEIGNVFDGLDEAKRRSIFERGAVLNDICGACALKPRCNYVYDNIDGARGAIIDDVTAVQCANERMITPIADGVAELLYGEENAMFIHKHYNAAYPVISLLEDRVGL